MELAAMLIFLSLGGLIWCLIYIAISLNEMTQITQRMVETLNRIERVDITNK